MNSCLFLKILMYGANRLHIRITRTLWSLGWLWVNRLSEWTNQRAADDTFHRPSCQLIIVQCYSKHSQTRNQWARNADMQSVCIFCSNSTLESIKLIWKQTINHRFIVKLWEPISWQQHCMTLCVCVCVCAFVPDQCVELPSQENHRHTPQPLLYISRVCVCVCVKLWAQ